MINGVVLRRLYDRIIEHKVLPTAIVHWRKLLGSGHFSTIEEIADAENINPSYVSWVLRMTLLAPEIVEAILAGQQPEGLTMARAMQPFPWQWQRQVFS